MVGDTAPIISAIASLVAAIVGTVVGFFLNRHAAKDDRRAEATEARLRRIEDSLQELMRIVPRRWWRRSDGR